MKVLRVFSAIKRRGEEERIITTARTAHQAADHAQHFAEPYDEVQEFQNVQPWQAALQTLIEAAQAQAEGEEGTLPTGELFGDQKKVTPANMFLSVGRSDLRDAIAAAQALIKERGIQQ